MSRPRWNLASWASTRKGHLGEADDRQRTPSIDPQAHLSYADRWDLAIPSDSAPRRLCAFPRIYPWGSNSSMSRGSPRRPSVWSTTRFLKGTSCPSRPHATALPLLLRARLSSTAGARDQWRWVSRTWRACPEVARALCRLRVFLCRVRAALDPAPAPVLGMAAAAAAPGGGLLCAEAGGGASTRTKATPIEAKIALRMARSPSCLPATTAPSCSISLYTLIARPGALTLKLGNPHLHRARRTIGP
jgi:hypothetical protein